MKENPQESLHPPQKRWFAVVVNSSHVEGGGGREGDHTNYVYARGAVDALNRAQRMRGWKKNIGRKSFPEIRELSSDESRGLEERIKGTPNVRLSQAKHQGFYGRREKE